MDEASKAAGAEEETCEMSFERFFREIWLIVLVRVFWGRGETCEMSFWG